jgi:site-specific recombinase XerD
MFLSKRPNGIYYLYYEQSNAKRTCISTKCKLKSEAVKFLREFSVDKDEQKNKKQISLKKYIAHFLKYSETVHSNNTTKTIQTTFNAFQDYCSDILLRNITQLLILNYLDSRLKKSIYQARKDLINLSSAFSRAVDEGLLDENPCKGIKRIKIPEKQPLYFSKCDIDELLKVINEDDIKDLVLFALNTGMRQMELLTLEWNQIDANRRIVTLDNRNHLTKSKRVRSIPLNRTALEIINRRESNSNVNVFTIDGKQITQDSISNRFNRIIKKTELNQKLNFHSLRHTFASWLVQKGAPIYQISKLLGHSNIKTTEIYAHLSSSELLKSTELLD